MCILLLLQIILLFFESGSEYETKKYLTIIMSFLPLRPTCYRLKYWATLCMFSIICGIIELSEVLMRSRK